MAQPRRNSKQRTLVLDVLKASHEHPNAEEVYLAVKQQLPDISLGTVYRNLNLLEETGQIIRIQTGIGGDRFDAVTRMHPHLICTECGGVSDLDCQIDKETELLRQALQTSGAQIQDVQIRAWCICGRCRENKESREKLSILF